MAIYGVLPFWQSARFPRARSLGRHSGVWGLGVKDQCSGRPGIAMDPADGRARLVCCKGASPGTHGLKARAFEILGLPSTSLSSSPWASHPECRRQRSAAGRWC